MFEQRGGGNKMGQRDNFSSGDVNKLNGMYCRSSSGQRPVFGIGAAEESIDHGHTSTSSATTPRPSNGLWNLVGSLIGAFNGGGGRQTDSE